MAKFLNMWRLNPIAMSPDPAERAKMVEMMFAMADALMQSGQILESGFFSDGTSGYVITKEETKDAFMHTAALYPWMISEVREIISYETGKEGIRGALKAQMEAMKR
ncbi:MAG TPA: hypothetical protein VEF35_10515 [Candidatus Bathyarchaeia archaeon]|nr:hypothetical protein [Candidatus Bathyarchaeia archaeon]